ncbi:hypothetical protein ACU686_08260 [Yinghuangia aomiensis]
MGRHGRVGRHGRGGPGPHLHHVGALRRRRRHPVRDPGPLDPQRRHQLPRRRRRAVAAADGGDRRPVPRLRRLRRAPEPPPPRLRRTVPVPGDHLPGLVRGARPHRLLRILRPVDRRDVLRHRGLGATPTRPVRP